MTYRSDGIQIQALPESTNSLIISHTELKICFDQLAGSLRPAWELGLQESKQNISFPFRSGHKFETPKIAVHCHVYYLELFCELLSAWKNIQNKFLFITTNTAFKASIIEQILIHNEELDYLVIIVKNRGRDIAPLIYLLKHYLNGFDIVIHCHTKKTPQVDKGFGVAWRKSLIQATFPNEYLARKLVDLLVNVNSGIAMPWPHRFVAHNVNWGSNFCRIKSLMELVGFKINRSNFLYFPAGSFFWARVDALQPLLGLSINDLDFCPEPTPPDGALAHSLERCIGILPMLENRRSYAVWIDANTHGFTDAVNNSHLIALPTNDDLKNNCEDWFKDGLVRAFSSYIPAHQSLILS